MGSLLFLKSVLVGFCVFCLAACFSVGCMLFLFFVAAVLLLLFSLLLCGSILLEEVFFTVFVGFDLAFSQDGPRLDQGQGATVEIIFDNSSGRIPVRVNVHWLWTVLVKKRDLLTCVIVWGRVVQRATPLVSLKRVIRLQGDDFQINNRTAR